MAVSLLKDHFSWLFNQQLSPALYTSLYMKRCNAEKYTRGTLQHCKPLQSLLYSLRRDMKRNGNVFEELCEVSPCMQVLLAEESRNSQTSSHGRYKQAEIAR